MAKSARASSVKTNKQALKKNVFGPIETARTERLAAKLLELAAQPKPDRPTAMEVEEEKSEKPKTEKATKDDSMDIDSGPKTRSKKQVGRVAKAGIAKRKAKKSSIVFPKFGDRRSQRKKK